MINKSDVATFRTCERRGFLAKFGEGEQTPLTPGELGLRKQGEEIGVMARKLWDGVLIDERPLDTERASEKTLQAMAEGANILYEATFLYDDCVARTDVLKRSTDGSWELFEVKSSLSVKKEHVLDAAFQLFVLTGAGLDISKVSIVHIDPEYSTTTDPPVPTELFTCVDVSQQAQGALSEVAADTARLREVIKSSVQPYVVPNTHCKACECEFLSHCYAELPRFDATTLPRVSFQSVAAWHESGVRDIAQLPVADLTPKQRLIQSVVASGSPHVDHRLQEELSKYVAPIAFVDFEADTGAIPIIPGQKAYAPTLFQWSMHIVGQDGTLIDHKEHLCTRKDDPREAFASSLYFALQGAKTIVTYSSYEKTRIRALATAGIDFSNELLRLFESSIDLLKTVDSNVYFADFLGQTSIKVVYPVLVPEASYADLAIQDGNSAAAEFRRMRSAATSPEGARDIASALRSYCKRDTLAMVEIYRRLLELSAINCTSEAR